MTAVVVLNVVLCAFVVLGIVSLLGWSIHRSRQVRVATAAARRERVAARRSPATRGAQLRPFPQ
jgi:predicted negative regulator of RcsB-dependent stress response